MRRQLIVLLAFGVLLAAAGCATPVRPAPQVPVDLALFFSDFERIPEGVSEEDALQMSPFGWIASGNAENWSVKLSKDVAYEGTYSMLVLVDPGTTNGIHISSRPIPVEEGTEYKATAMMYNVADEPYGRRTDLYLEFWGENGWWGSNDYWSFEYWQTQGRGAWGTKDRLHHVATSGTLGEWVEVTTTAVAPPGAKYATISFWTSSRVLKSYIDNVRLEVNEP